MPTLRLHFPEELLTEENKEDLLAFLNKGIKEKDKQFKDFTAFIRKVLRDYAVGSMQSFRQWKSTGIIGTPNGRVSMPDMKLWQGDGIEQLDDGMEGKDYPLTIGGLQYEYLKKAIVWENTFQRDILKGGIEHKDVARLAQYLIITTILQLQREVDEEKLRLEEEGLKEEKA